MPNELVERLRNLTFPYGRLLEEAAAEIERLEKTVKSKHDDAADAAAQGFDWMTRAQVAEAKLAAVEALAEKWQDSACCTLGNPCGDPDCTDALVAAGEVKTALEHNNDS